MNVVRLDTVASVHAGGRLGYSGKNFVATGVPAYGAAGVNGRLAVAEYSNRQAVILSSIGARCGKCFLAEGSWTSLANTQVILPDLSRVDARFLWYQLNDESSWPRSGSAQPFIKPNDVKSRMVYLPALEEQRRIAAILDHADALRAKRRQVLAHLDTLTQAIFHKMFSGTDWPTAALADVVRSGTIVTYGIVQAGAEFDGGVPYIRTGDIADGQVVSVNLRHTDPVIAARFERSTVRGGDIVMSIRATVGTTALVPPELDGANLTQGTARIAPGELALVPYLLEFLRSPAAQRWIQAQIKGATFREITLTRLRELQVALPPISCQEEFARRIFSVDKQRFGLQNALAAGDELFESLQSRAFDGRL